MTRKIIRTPDLRLSDLPSTESDVTALGRFAVTFDYDADGLITHGAKPIGIFLLIKSCFIKSGKMGEGRPVALSGTLREIQVLREKLYIEQRRWNNASSDLPPEIRLSWSRIVDDIRRLMM